MKAKLLRDAGEIHEGAAVDIVSCAGRNDSRTSDERAGQSKAPARVYEVADDDGHSEKVDTRDLQVLP